MRRILLSCLLSLPLAAGDNPTIESLLLKHRKLSGTAPEILAERARLRFLSGDVKGGEEDLSSALFVGETRGEVLRLAALARLTAGQLEKATALHEQMIKVAPKADDAFSHAAVDLVQAELPEKADAMMERAFQLDPRDWEEILHFAFAAARARQTALSVKWYGRIQAMDRSDSKQVARPFLEFLLGAGMVEEAGALVERMLVAQPREWELALGVAQAATQVGNKALAAHWSQRALELGEDQPTLLLELALLQQGKVKAYRR